MHWAATGFVPVLEVRLLPCARCHSNSVVAQARKGRKLSNDDHQYNWALETGGRWDTVDDEDANYHGPCGETHAHGDANCPLSQDIRYNEMSSDELLGELGAARRWLARARGEELAAYNKITAIKAELKSRSINDLF